MSAIFWSICLSNVFISYESATRDQAKQLADQLTGLGYSIWWDNSLIPAGSYSTEITKHLDAARAIIVIWSTEAADSLWVKSEASHAASQAKLINTHASGFNPGKDIPRPFEQIHCVPLTNINAIVETLRQMKVPRGARQLEPATATALASEDLLPFLKVCSNDELDPLVNYIDKAWNADRLYEHSLKKNPLYPEHADYVDEIDRNMRAMGGNAIANFFKRGDSFFKAEGPPYKTILLDLCGRDKIETTATHTVPELEKKYIIKKFDDAYARMTPEQKAEFAQSINEEMAKRGSTFRIDGSMAKPAAAIVMMAGAEAAGFFIFQAAAILANAFAQVLIGSGLAFATNTAMMRVLGGVIGPIGWIATGVYTTYQFTTPAYTSLEPAVIHVAALREMKLYGRDGLPAPSA